MRHINLISMTSKYRFDDKHLEEIIKNNNYICGNTINIINKKYSINDLTYIIKTFTVSQGIILETQKLTPEFCVEYILNNNYSLTDSDLYITDLDIIKYQKHINENDLKNARDNKK